MRGLPAGIFALAALAAFSIGGILGITSGAAAFHFHTTCNDHGMVHGNSVSDSAYHGRIMGAPCVGDVYCEVGQFEFSNPPVKQAWLPKNTTCDVLIIGYGPECAGWGGSGMAYRMSYHQNGAHSSCWPRPTNGIWV